MTFEFFLIDKNNQVVTSLNDAIIANDIERDRVQLCPVFSKEASKSGSEKTNKLKGTFEIGSQYHFSMEPQTCVVVPTEDGIDVYSSTQWMDVTQIAIAEALKLPLSLINMQVRRLGGGFGGKISRPALIASAAAVAAHHLNRPVRLILTIEANMNIVGKRYPCISNYEVEVDGNGKIQKLLNDYVEDYGCCFNEPAYLTTGFFSNCYESDTFDVIAKRARTDTPSNTWCRGPGTVEGIVMIENIMEHIAWNEKKDPLEIRLNNISDASDMKKHLRDFAESIGKAFFFLI